MHFFLLWHGVSEIQTYDLLFSIYEMSLLRHQDGASMFFITCLK